MMKTHINRPPAAAPGPVSQPPWRWPRLGSRAKRPKCLPSTWNEREMWIDLVDLMLDLMENPGNSVDDLWMNCGFGGRSARFHGGLDGKWWKLSQKKSERWWIHQGKLCGHGKNDAKLMQIQAAQLVPGGCRPPPDGDFCPVSPQDMGIYGTSKLVWTEKNKCAEAKMANVGLRDFNSLAIAVGAKSTKFKTLRNIFSKKTEQPRHVRNSGSGFL